MTCIEPTPTRPVVHPLQWEYLRKQLLKVRWPETADPSSAFTLVQGILFGLEMAGVISQTANQRMFRLMSNAQERRWAEEREATNQQ